MAGVSPGSTKRIIPVILAAGSSHRMGSPKALLKLNTDSFIRHIISLYASAGCGDIVVVLGAHRREVEEHLLGLDLHLAVNENYGQGQLSSIIVGIGKAATLGADSVIVHPVDHPLVPGDVVNSMIESIRRTDAPIVLPVHRGRRGHPVAFSSSLFEELKAAPSEVGARAVVWSHAQGIFEVETEEEGILLNVDTPEAYELLRKRFR